MKLKLPNETTVKLNLSVEEDPDQSAYIVVRQATQREKERRAELGADASRIFREKEREVEVRQKWNYEEQKRMEVYLTLVDCNIVLDVDGTERPLFRFKQDSNGRGRLTMSEDQFKDAWGLLSGTCADAIHDAVLQVNPQWGANAGE